MVAAMSFHSLRLTLHLHEKLFYAIFIVLCNYVAVVLKLFAMRPPLIIPDTPFWKQTSL